jgi:hypothetical protein
MDSYTNTNFVDKSFRQVPGGQYDENGFYYTPNGSFWDPDGVYFNKNGFDRHGGYYDEHLEYHPGAGWIDDLMCYEDEKEETLKNVKGRRRNGDDLGEDEDNDLDDPLNEVYDEIDYDKLLREEEKKHLEPIKENQNEETNINTKQNNNVFKPGTSTKKENSIENKKEVISPDLLFNKIPENKKPSNIINEEKRKEKAIEVDSLFN